MRRHLQIALLATVAVVMPALLLSGCQPKQVGKMPGIGAVPKETTETSVFFSTGRSLVEEPRVVDASKPYESSLKELLAALPEKFTTIAIVQPTAKVNSVTYKDGIVTIDWNKEVLSFDAEPKEKRLALAAILATMGEYQNVEKVRFTVEGKTSGTIDGKDVAAFWGEVSLNGQPWKVIRVVSKDASGTTIGDSPSADR